MNYAETAIILEALSTQSRPVRVTLDLDEGEVTVPLQEAIDHWNSIAPGEAFQITSITIVN